jgi:hypothetical protein
MIRGNLADQIARARENSVNFDVPEYLPVPSIAEFDITVGMLGLTLTDDQRNRLLKEFKVAEGIRFAPVFGFDFTRGNPSPLVLLGGEAFGNPNAYQEVAAAVDSQLSGPSSVGDQPPQTDDLPPPVLSEPAIDPVESAASAPPGTTRELSDPATLVADLNEALNGARQVQEFRVAPTTLAEFLRSNSGIFPRGTTIENLTMQIQNGHLSLGGEFSRRGRLGVKRDLAQAAYSIEGGELVAVGHPDNARELDILLRKGLDSQAPEGGGWGVSNIAFTDDGQFKLRFSRPSHHIAKSLLAERPPVVPEDEAVLAEERRKIRGALPFMLDFHIDRLVREFGLSEDDRHNTEAIIDAELRYIEYIRRIEATEATDAEG